MKKILLGLLVAGLFLLFSILAGQGHALAACGALLGGFLVGAGLSSLPPTGKKPTATN